MKKLKIGIIIDDMTVPKYYLDFIHKMCEEHSFFFKPIIINQNINSTHHYDKGKYYVVFDYAKDELI